LLVAGRPWGCRSGRPTLGHVALRCQLGRGPVDAVRGGRPEAGGSPGQSTGQPFHLATSERSPRPPSSLEGTSAALRAARAPKSASRRLPTVVHNIPPSGHTHPAASMKLPSKGGPWPMSVLFGALRPVPPNGGHLSSIPERCWMLQNDDQLDDRLRQSASATDPDLSTPCEQPKPSTLPILLLLSCCSYYCHNMHREFLV
jgi:hypothetical protein